MQIRLRFKGDDPRAEIDVEFRTLAAVRAHVEDQAVGADEASEKHAFVGPVSSAPHLEDQLAKGPEDTKSGGDGPDPLFEKYFIHIDSGS